LNGGAALNNSVADSMIRYEATPEVQKVIANLGRTEDIRFSPSKKILAIAAFGPSKIILLKIDIEAKSGRPKISITDYLEISSMAIEKPHGVTFIDEETLVVANRSQFISIFKVPCFKANEKEVELHPLRVIRKKGFRKLHSPGSVEVYSTGESGHRLLICDNYAHVVTTVQVTTGNGLRTDRNRILTAKGLDIPDGISVSTDRKWIAVSNHTPGTVFIYANTAKLNRRTEPVAVLHGMDCPHGLRFTRQDRMIVIADAASPYLYLYINQKKDWSGDYHAYRFIRALDDKTFQLGRHNEQEGGIKGIDIETGVLVTTCEFQPLTFYNFNSLEPV
jgi:hypothetical protein